MKITDEHFRILGVTKTSTKDQIKKAYRLAIKTWHPDKFAQNPELLQKSQEITKKLNEAYSLLGNYDSNLSKLQPKINENHRINVKHYKITSWNIVSAGYDENMKILQVQTRKGNLFQFYNISESFFKNLIINNSKGLFDRKRILFKDKPVKV